MRESTNLTGGKSGKAISKVYPINQVDGYATGSLAVFGHFLEDLIKTLLYQRMTVQIHVDYLYLDALGVPTRA